MAMTKEQLQKLGDQLTDAMCKNLAYNTKNADAIDTADYEKSKKVVPYTSEKERLQAGVEAYDDEPDDNPQPPTAPKSPFKG